MPAAIELATLLLQAASALAPQIEADFQKGTVTPEQQAALQSAVDLIKKSGFSGEEWDITK